MTLASMMGLDTVKGPSSIFEQLRDAIMVRYDMTDFSTMTETAGRIERIEDLSGNNIRQEQLAVSLQPVWAPNLVNGQGGLVFDGTRRIQSSGVFSVPGPCTVMLVSSVNDPALAQTQTYTDGTDANNRLLIFHGSNTVTNLHRGTGPGIAGGNSPTGANIHSGNFDGASSIYYINGAVVGTGTTGTGTLTFFRFGQNYVSSGGLVGNIYYFILFNRLLTADEHNEVGNELATMFGRSWTTIV